MVSQPAPLQGASSWDGERMERGTLRKGHCLGAAIPRLQHQDHLETQALLPEMDLSEEWVISSVLSRHNKNLKQWTLKPSDRLRLSSQRDRVTALGQIRFTAPCYSSVLFRK